LLSLSSAWFFTNSVYSTLYHGAGIMPALAGCLALGLDNSIGVAFQVCAVEVVKVQQLISQNECENLLLINIKLG
jgi:hypothetical protein